MARELIEEVYRATDSHGPDAAVGILAFLAISTTWMDWLDVLFKVLIAFLTIVLLLQRIYVSCQRNRRRKRDPLQR